MRLLRYIVTAMLLAGSPCLAATEMFGGSGSTDASGYWVLAYPDAYGTLRYPGYYTPSSSTWPDDWSEYPSTVLWVGREATNAAAWLLDTSAVGTNDGILTNNAAFVSGTNTIQSYIAIDDATGGSCVFIPDSASLSAMPAFSLLAWTRLNALAANEIVMSKRGSNLEWWIRYDNGFVEVDVYGQNALNDNAWVEAGVWQPVGLIWDGSTAIVRYGANSNSYAFSPSPVDGDGDVLLGDDTASGGGEFNGGIAETTIFSNAISYAEWLNWKYHGAYNMGFQRYLMNTNDALAYAPDSRWSNAVLACSFEDPNFTTGKLRDWSASGNNGTPTDMAAATTNDNGYGVFNGSTSKVTIPDGASITGAQARTICALYRYDSLPANAGPLVSFGPDTTGNRYSVKTQGDEIRIEIRGANIVTASANLSTGVWYHIAACLPAGGNLGDTLIYVNGVLTPHSASTATVNTSSGSVFLGTYPSNLYPLPAGSMDEVLVSTECFTSNQVYQLSQDALGRVQ